MDVTVSKWGNSLGLRLPKDLLSSHNVNEGDILTVSTDGAAIVLVKKRRVKRHDINDLLRGFNGNEDLTEFDWGAPQGREL